MDFDKTDKKDEDKFASFMDTDRFLAPKPQLEEQEEPKPEKKRSYKPKPVKKDEPKLPPVATKTCTVRLEDCTVGLVEGQPVEGLTGQELKHLKFHKFIK